MVKGKREKLGFPFFFWQQQSSVRGVTTITELLVKQHKKGKSSIDRLALNNAYEQQIISTA